MSRPLRIEYPGAYYHVINRGQSRRSIFIEDQGRQTFLDLLADMTRLWNMQKGSSPLIAIDVRFPMK